MSIQKTCPNCGTELPPDAPAGVCPKCLLKVGIHDPSAESADAPTLHSDSGAPADSPPIPPTQHSGTTSESAPQIGAKIKYFGDYELLGEIARGGMGVVYRARQVRLNRAVALKMILSGQFAGEADVQRFHTEAEAAAQLDHPGIVPIYEVGEYEGHHFFSMALVEGDSLASRIADGPIPAIEAAEVVLDISKAIEYAHEQGVLHRDLKPANILLDTEGNPRVTDFGLAKRVHGDSNLTATGQVLGTPSYMPPEQAAGRIDQVTESADLYALGAILYATLTGRPPFQADNPLDTLMQVLEREPVPPRTLNPKVPLDLETICLKCLEKDRRRRYPSAQALVDELQRFLNGEPIQARPISHQARVWRWCKRKPVISGLLATVAVTIVVAFAWITRSRNDALEARNQATRTAEENRELARKERDARGVADDRTKLAVQAVYSANMNLAQMNWDAGNLRALNHVLQRFADWKEDPLIQRDCRGWEWHYLWRRSRSHLQELSSTIAPHCLAYHPTGDLLLAGGSGGMTLWDVNTGKEKWSAKQQIIRETAFSADGSLIASSGKPQGAIWDAETGERIVEFHSEETSDGWAVSFDPKGRYVATACASPGEIRVWDVKTGRLLQSLKRDNWRDNYYAVAFSRDGQYLAAGSFHSRLEIWRVDGFQHVVTKRVPGIVGSIEFSSDEQHLAVGTRRGTSILTVVDWEQVALAEGYAREISFTPDGKRLLITGPNTIRVVNTETGETLRSAAVHIGSIMDVASAPNGQRFATAGINERNIKVWDQLDHRDSLELAHSHAPSEFAFSDNGALLAVAARDTSVRLWNATTGQPLHTFISLKGIANVTNKLALTRDGRLLAACGTYGVKVWDTRSGKLAWQRHSDARDVAFHPSENRLAVFCNGRIRLWNSSDGKQVAEFPASSEGRSTCLAFSSDGQLLASMYDKGAILVWNVQSKSVVWRAQVATHSSTQTTIAFSPDDRLLAVPAAEKLALFDVATGKLWKSLVGHQTTIRGVTFHPGGKRIATGAEVVKIWDLESGHEVQTLEGGSPVCFAPDGFRLVVSLDRSARVLDARALKDDVLIEREAVGLLRYLSSLPEANETPAVPTNIVSQLIPGLLTRTRSTEDLLQHVREFGGISDGVRQKALELLDPKNSPIAERYADD